MKNDGKGDKTFVLFVMKFENYIKILEKIKAKKVKYTMKFYRPCYRVDKTQRNE